MLISRSIKHIVMFFIDIYQSRELLFELVRRDLMSKYRETVVGFFWNVIHPLALLGVYSFVFTVVFKVQKGVPGSFPIFLYCGLVPWLAFVETLSKCSGIIIANRSLVKRAVLPLEVLPSYVIVSSLVSQLIGVGILLTANMIVAKNLSPFLVVLPILFLLQGLFSLGLGMFVATLTVFFRDVNELVGVVLRFWMYLTPILYPESFLPEKWRFLVWMNPMALLVSMWRSVILDGTMPPLSRLVGFSVCTVVVFCGGVLFFRKIKWDFADVI